MSTYPTPRTDAELARVLVDFDLTNIDRREAMADFARLLEGELAKLGSDFGAVCRTNSENADAMITLVQANGEQRARIEAQALHNRELQAELARRDADSITLVASNRDLLERVADYAAALQAMRGVLAWLHSHPDAIQRNVDDHADGNNWALVLNEVLIGWFPSITAAAEKGMELEALLPGVPTPEGAADSLSLPCTELELARWHQAAEKAGYINLRAWVIDTLGKAALPHA